MTPPDTRLTEIAVRHVKKEGFEDCAYCGHEWPCDGRWLLDRLVRQERLLAWREEGDDFLSHRYRKKPVVVEAMQWRGGDFTCLNMFCGKNWGRADAIGEDGFDDSEQVMVYNSAEQQWIKCPINHWIIRGVSGELYPCRPDIFEATYDPA